MTPNLNNFVRIVTERSNENTASILTLHHQKNYGTCISLLRQELDSLIRVCYLNTLSDTNEIERLIKDTVNGIQWGKDRKRITDRRMVNIASQYNHWAPEVYDFGNSFTYLTNFHDYRNNDPLKNLDTTQKQTIRHYLNSYHGFQAASEITFDNVIPYYDETFCITGLIACIKENDTLFFAIDLDKLS
jgi:hypothetical protein